MEKETKLRKIKVLSYVFLALVFGVGVFFYSNIEIKKNNNAEIVSVIEPSRALTEKQDYSLEDELKVKIENRENGTMCFSTCSPYMIQTKKDDWIDYSSFECDKESVAEKCIDPNQLKVFGIKLNEMSLESAIHRLVIPVCIGCTIGEQFRVDKIIYSNEFKIK